MRYAIIREVEGLPAAAVQRRRLEAVGFDVALEEGLPTGDGQRALRRLLSKLKAQDELVVYALDVLQMSTAELVLTLRRFFELGVSLRLVGGSMLETVSTGGGVPRVLSLLADHEARWPSRGPVSRKSRARHKPLSRYQLDYARDLRRKGQSLRTIGLLFQVTPHELVEMMGRDAIGPTGEES